jgi:hypothetical protein
MTESEIITIIIQNAPQVAIGLISVIVVIAVIIIYPLRMMLARDDKKDSEFKGFIETLTKTLTNLEGILKNHDESLIELKRTIAETNKDHQVFKACIENCKKK